MIDLHAHPLPGLDDGPDSLPEALSLARAAVEAGTTTVVATPHIDHIWNVAPEEVPIAVAALTAALARERIDLEVVKGGEVASSRLRELDPAQRDAVRLGDGPYLLVECPHSPAAAGFDRLVFDLLAEGQPVVLAHPERCPVFLRRPEVLTRLLRSGALSSITAGSMAGTFGPDVRRFTLWLLREGLVHDVASDAHDARLRPPGVRGAFQRAEPDLPGIAGQADWYTRDVPAAILAGDPLPPRPELAPPQRPSLRDRWRRAAWFRRA